MSNVDVTVIVPCYNTERYLDQALTSIEANDRVRLEIIAINDGSTDGSLEIMRRHADTDVRVRVIDKANQGYGASVNRGFDEARGTYVTILEPDDYIVAHAYDELFEAAERSGYPDMVKSAYWRVLDAETPDERVMPCQYHNAVYPPRRRFTIVEEPNFLRYHPSIWSALYRRAFLEGCGIRMMEVPGAGWVDNPFLFETFVQASGIVYVNDMYYCYRENLPGSSSDIKLSLLPFERWNNQAEVLERLGVTDAGIWGSLYARAFEFLSYTVEHGGLEDEVYRVAMREVCECMDERAVHALSMVEPYKKKAYYLVKGLEAPSDLKSVFVRGRLADFGRTLAHYGPVAFGQRVGSAIGRRVRRA